MIRWNRKTVSVDSLLTIAALQRNKNTQIQQLANENDAAKNENPCIFAGKAMMGMLADMAPTLLIACVLVVLLAGFVKGVVGFALPMILVSGIGSLMPAEIAIAALILPTMATNLAQSLHNGIGHAVASFRRFWRYNLVMFATILGAAQLVTRLPESLLFIILGGPVILFALLQLAGWQPKIRAGFEFATEMAVSLTAGFFGGLTGVWGPPTVLYLTALEIPKNEHVRIQGVMYLMGSMVLFGAHLKSGVLNAQTLPYSALLILPAMAGQWAGRQIHDSIDQTLFRRLTLFVLVLAGLNLLRRGVWG